MSKTANYVLGTFGALVVGLWAIVALGEDGNADPQSNLTTKVETVSEVVKEPELTSPVPAAPATMASAYPVESCKAAIAVIMGRDPKIIQGRKISDGTIHVFYRRPDDGKRWEARCEMIGDNQLRWAAFNAFGDGQLGRWRVEDRIDISISGGNMRA